MVTIKLENVSKDFGHVRAVDNVSFEVYEGEVVTLLGPSGCGKTTTLRMIAGFIIPDEGRILFGDRDVTDLPPQDRNTAMVFQNYALWPHLSVKKNVEFGLSIRKIPKEERNRRVEEALTRVQLKDYIDSMPNKLSGGQQQRVAVARALVVNPDVLLLDEPLSNLDAKLRVETRQDIRDLVKDLELTTIFVTHDQSEALSISDRIAVLDIGHLRQIGSPEDIWTAPTTAFVGSFIGEANTLEMEVSEITTDFVKLNLSESGKEGGELYSTYHKGINKVGQKVRVVIRPQRIKLSYEKSGDKNIIKAKVKLSQFFGSHTLIIVSIGNGESLNVHVPGNVLLKRHQTVFLEIPSNELRVFGPDHF